MNEQLGLRVLSRVLNWDDERARAEFAWLRMMARIKYDGYRDFRAGIRFIESLATWLQQFRPEHRETAYQFVRERLVYVGPTEMQLLVQQLYPRFIWERLASMVADRHGIPRYRVLAEHTARQALEQLRRRTLIMGLSDGARIDIVRHSNAGVLTNEQLVVATQVDADKWADLRKSLRSETGDPNARFAVIYLVDDFMGTGTSLLRQDPDDPEKKWKGKLTRFKASLDAALNRFGDTLLEPEWHLEIHHYVASDAAVRAIREREIEARTFLCAGHWARETHFSFGAQLPADFPLSRGSVRDRSFVALTDQYYDPSLRNRHTDVGGADHLGLGYGGCALPLVLDHNCPNNSIALLWAETSGVSSASSHAMRPLFRRRQRHST